MPTKRVEWAQYDEELEARWLAGHSAAEIANDIPGASRHAVIGRAHRLGLSGRGPKPHTRGERALQPSRPRAAKPKPPPAPKPPKPPRVKVVQPDELTATARPWESRSSGECAWPFLVDGRTWSCCAAAEATYCDQHAALAYSGSITRDELARLAKVR